MIYITEQNLRDLYGKQAFESFTLVEGERLTPGARQFLADRQISIVDPADVKPSKTATIRIDGTEEYSADAPTPAEPKETAPSATPVCDDTAAPDPNLCNEKLKGRFCALQALYLKQATELYAQNQILANEIFDMELSLIHIYPGQDGSGRDWFRQGRR